MSYHRHLWRTGRGVRAVRVALRSTFRALVPRRTIYHISSTTPGGNGDRQGEPEVRKQRVPLDAEWAEMARKQLKGADPSEKLAWRTSEVQFCRNGCQ